MSPLAIICAGAKPAFTNPVVNRSPRDAEELGSLVNRDAASELRLKDLVVGFDLEAVLCAEGFDRSLLRFQAETAAALLGF